MKPYIVQVGTLTYRTFQSHSIDAVIEAMERFPEAGRIVVRLQQIS